MGAPTSAESAAVWQFEAIGTVWRIETSEPLAATARRDVGELIASFDADWSRFRSDSTISALARDAGSAPAPPDAVAMLDTFVSLHHATDGAVNPLVGRSLESRGYDSSYGLLDRGARPAPRDWRALLTWTDGFLRLSEPATIDVGALGKGRLVDRVVEQLAPESGASIVVDAGGDIALRGAPQRIGLEHPYDARRAIGAIEIADAALCASATNRRAWGDGLHHVLDARTGEPVRTMAATWAIAPTAMQADAIATALFFEGGAELAFDWGVQWVRMTTDGRVEWSPGSTAELFV